MTEAFISQTEVCLAWDTRAWSGFNEGFAVWRVRNYGFQSKV